MLLSAGMEYPAAHEFYRETAVRVDHLFNLIEADHIALVALAQGTPELPTPQGSGQRQALAKGLKKLVFIANALQVKQTELLRRQLEAFWPLMANHG